MIFLCCSSEVGQADAEAVRFWTDVQVQSADERAKSFQLARWAGQETATDGVDGGAKRHKSS